MDTAAWKKKLVRLMEDNRGLIVLLFCLPASFLFDLVLQLRNWFNRTFLSASQRHDTRVRQIQSQDLCHKISIPLYDILELKVEVITVRVEPMVTVGDISRYLIPKGYTLAVTLEIADATLGGLAFGVGMTTYSHKVDALELQIIPVKPYVKMEYIPINGQKEYCDKIRELSGAMDKDKQTPDFVEATIFSKHEAVLMVGHFANVKNAQERAQVNHVARWLLFGWLLPPKPAFLKFTTTPGIRAMTFTKQVFQDIVLPINVLEKQIDVAEEIFDAYPILVYPCRIYDHGPHTGQLRPPRSDQMCPGTKWGMFNDLGVYGVPGPVKRKKRFDAVGAMRKMEKFTRDVGGYPFSYADIFMNRKEFEEMFDLVAYEKARAKYHAYDAFPHLYDKKSIDLDKSYPFL
ncbi:hypothetical protein DAPPUDRAFT_106816 [Daphnia pulex]|uniref:Delta(24)-sterol reductase n=1 Tax=Daphnia pulex TaxID=6669 RepID=E9GV13_DAPPU|nr:hypothetical protein DAPPUDRAFT_106816 [Daphnia pulex]|eukprot:EFX76695.1 hypothetical protein DAPPUDRAFT_106816 [Daphnia pulex]